MKKCKIGSYSDCIELSNGEFRIAVTSKQGPRIIGCYAGDDEQNLFAVLPKRKMKGVDTGFRLFGGHRLGHGPEDLPRSYQPDNDAVEINETEGGLEFSAPIEPLTGLRKHIRISKGNFDMFMITHSIENCGLWELELAPRALSMMAPGGMAVIPQLRDPEAWPMSPDRSLMLWPYASFADPRLQLGDEYIFLKQDGSISKPTKIGFNAQRGWIAYLLKDKALIKYFDIYEEGTEYPDYNCNVASYSCEQFCEIETLGPLDIVPPGESAEHNEYWQIISELPEIKSEEDFKEHVEPQLIDKLNLEENYDDYDDDYDDYQSFDYDSCCEDPHCQGEH
ncbi:MAG: hypothetical protein PHG44_08315 [Lentisphaeria bacterium]|jgi:hypothetical protein|nr:hypothetical protein [Lentisphaeria bacterium]